MNCHWFLTCDFNYSQCMCLSHMHFSICFNMTLSPFQKANIWWRVEGTHWFPWIQFLPGNKWYDPSTSTTQKDPTIKSAMNSPLALVTSPVKFERWIFDGITSLSILPNFLKNMQGIRFNVDPQSTKTLNTGRLLPLAFILRALRYLELWIDRFSNSIISSLLNWKWLAPLHW